MKRIILSLIICLFIPACCFAKTKELQFRMVLNKDESPRVDFDKYSDEEGQAILVDRKALLSNKDIEQIGINKDEYGRPLVVVGFTESGKKIYLDLTKKNVNRRLAEVLDGKFLATSIISSAVGTGVAAVPVSSTGYAEALIKDMGFAPYLQREIDTDKNAEISYGYARYAMQIGKDKIARKIALQLYKYDAKSEFLKKLVKEYPALNVEAISRDKLDKAYDAMDADTNYFYRTEPPKRQTTAVEPDSSVTTKTELRPNLVTGKSAPRRVFTGPEESRGSSPWPAAPPRKKVKPIVSSK